MKFTAALILVVAFAGSSSHAALLYTFSGIVPASVAPSHPAVTPGESWVASFVINAVAGVPAAGFTEYPTAVVSGTLKFSGGYVSPLDFAGFNLNVYKNSEFDAVYVYGTVDGHGVGFQAISDLNPLPSTDLPLAGASFGPSPSPTADASYVQLVYSDDLGDVFYTGIISNNVSFAAFVPEPASSMLGCIGALTLLAHRRRAPLASC